SVVKNFHLLQFNQFFHCGSWLTFRLILVSGNQFLRSSPEIDKRSLVDTGDRTVGRTALLREILALNIGYSVLGERNSRKASLLRAIVNQCIFTDVQIASTRSTAPVVRFSGR